MSALLVRTYKAICPLCGCKTSGINSKIRRVVCLSCKLEIDILLYNRRIQVYSNNMVTLYKIVCYKLDGDMNMFNYIKKFITL